MPICYLSRISAGTLLFMTLWLTPLACKRDDGIVIWSAESRSPNGSFLATASSRVWEGGLGTGYAATSVYLKQLEQAPVEILEFEDNADTRPKLIWISPTHLDVAYEGRARINLETIKFAGVDISIRDISDGISSAAK